MMIESYRTLLLKHYNFLLLSSYTRWFNWYVFQSLTRLRFTYPNKYEKWQNKMKFINRNQNANLSIFCQWVYIFINRWNLQSNLCVLFMYLLFYMRVMALICNLSYYIYIWFSASSDAKMIGIFRFLNFITRYNKRQ